MPREKSSSVRATSETSLNKTTTLALPSGVAVEDGTSTRTSATKKVFQITGITTGTLHIDGSADGTNWTTLGNVTANGKIANDEPWPYVRARISAWTAGTFVAKMCE